MEIRYRDGYPAARSQGQEKALQLLYGNVFGRFLLKLLTRRWLSCVAGWFLSTRLSRVFIRSFIRKNHIDMTQYEAGPFGSFNEFFSRKILPAARPMDLEPRHLMSPCDSKLTVFPITRQSRFTIKNTEYTVASLLQNEDLAREYEGGLALVFRLSVEDYHRYHYAVSGKKSGQVHIRGRLHTVNPIANDHYPIYKENTREYCTLENPEFGKLVVMEVGALLVGRILNHHGEAKVQRGEEKGMFLFGGSTVVMLLQAGAAEMDADIMENSRKLTETVVRCGEKIGVAKM